MEIDTNNVEFDTLGNIGVGTCVIWVGVSRKMNLILGCISTSIRLNRHDKTLHTSNNLKENFVIEYFVTNTSCYLICAHISRSVTYLYSPTF